MADENPWKRRGEEWRRLTKALAVPSVFLGGPVGGAFLGYIASLWVGYREACLLAGILLGLAAAVWELVRTTRASAD